jgi:hypothetical protein
LPEGLAAFNYFASALGGLAQVVEHKPWLNGPFELIELKPYTEVFGLIYTACERTGRALKSHATSAHPPACNAEARVRTVSAHGSNIRYRCSWQQKAGHLVFLTKRLESLKLCGELNPYRATANQRIHASHRDQILDAQARLGVGLKVSLKLFDTCQVKLQTRCPAMAAKATQML